MTFETRSDEPMVLGQQMGNIFSTLALIDSDLVADEEDR
jgi:hypothetical protein